MITVAKLKVGESGIIKKVNIDGDALKGAVSRVAAEGRIRRRLLDMGVTPGAEIVMRKKAPLGDPLEITTRGYSLCIRTGDADKIFVEKE